MPIAPAVYAWLLTIVNCSTVIRINPHNGALLNRKSGRRIVVFDQTHVSIEKSQNGRSRRRHEIRIYGRPIPQIGCAPDIEFGKELGWAKADAEVRSRLPPRYHRQIKEWSLSSATRSSREHVNVEVRHRRSSRWGIPLEASQLSSANIFGRTVPELSAS
jgi:hypothetical protein